MTHRPYGSTRLQILVPCITRVFHVRVVLWCCMHSISPIYAIRIVSAFVPLHYKASYYYCMWGMGKGFVFIKLKIAVQHVEQKDSSKIIFLNKNLRFLQCSKRILFAMSETEFLCLKKKKKSILILSKSKYKNWPDQEEKKLFALGLGWNWIRRNQSWTVKALKSQKRNYNSTYRKQLRIVGLQVGMVVQPSFSWLVASRITRAAGWLVNARVGQLDIDRFVILLCLSLGPIHHQLANAIL